ncbi:hypothetical protein O9992_30600 [Vibrio lentus]|nr:hypothetical protein [Vibrio lentus]
MAHHFRHRESVNWIRLGSFEASRHSVDGSVLDQNLNGAKTYLSSTSVSDVYGDSADFLNYLKTNYGSVYSYTHGLCDAIALIDFNGSDGSEAFLKW